MGQQGEKLQKTITGILDACRSRTPLGKSELILVRTKQICRDESVLPEPQGDEGKRLLFFYSFNFKGFPGCLLCFFFTVSSVLSCHPRLDKIFP